MALDEFFALNLIADPSWQHAVGSWNQGADSGGILYYVLLWPLVHMSHGSVLVARLFSAACYFLSALVWWRTLARFLDPKSAALGVLLVWLSSPLLLVYVGEVRFYTPFLLFAAIAVWATLHAAQGDLPLPQAAVLVLSAHTCLVLIHMLGILYSGLIAAATLLFLVPRKRALILTACIVASWLALLPCHTAIRNGSANATSQAVPVFRDVLRFHLKASASLPVVLIASIGLLWLVRERFPRSDGTEQRRRLPQLAPILSLAFLASPMCLYVLSVVGRPLGASRYLLPYYLSLATLCACAFARLRSVSQGWASRLLQVAAAGLVIAMHVLAIRKVPPGPTLELGNLRQIAAGRPVVVLDEQTFFELQYYRSTPQLQFHFLNPPARGRPEGMMATIASRGYFPGSMDEVDNFERTYPEFLVIARSLAGSEPWFVRNPTCSARQVGTVRISWSQPAVYDVTGCKPPGSEHPRA